MSIAKDKTELPEWLVEIERQIDEGCERAKDSPVLVGQSETFFTQKASR